MTVLFSEVTQLMGKWAYTARILYKNPFVTPTGKKKSNYFHDGCATKCAVHKPLIMFSMCEHTVRTAANCFLVPNHFSTFKVFLLAMWMSTAKCLKFRLRTPRGPFIVTIRDLTVASIPFGILTHWLELMVLIVPLERNTKKVIVVHSSIKPNCGWNVNTISSVEHNPKQ